MEPRDLYDITRPLGERTPVWPGDTPYRTAWTLRRSEGAIANVAELRLSSHVGTHADAPYHCVDDGARVGAMALDVFIGPAVVVDVRGRASIDLAVVESVVGAGGVERVLFHTGCWEGADRFPARYPAIEPFAASRLREAGVRLVGTDAPSVDAATSTTLPAHHQLSGFGIAILENLLLDDVPPGRYELIALPLRLEDADASPVRAVLRTL